MFGEGITPNDLNIQINRGNADYGQPPQIAIGIGNNEGMLITMDNESWYGGDLNMSNFPVKHFVFADGRKLSLEQILARADGGIIGDYQTSTDNDDFLRGSVANDQIYGNAGDDKIEARENEDWIYGGTGNDVISAGSGRDEVYGDEGDDVIAGGGNDKIDTGNIWDYMERNDVLIGGEGSDTYAFNRGD